MLISRRKPRQQKSFKAGRMRREEQTQESRTVLKANGVDGGSQAQSELACGSCRRKKAKCDRKLPSCSVCLKSAQECTYPTGRLKPGPKLGSVQTRRCSCRRPPSMTSGEGDVETADDADAEESPHLDAAEIPGRDRSENKISGDNSVDELQHGAPGSRMNWLFTSQGSSLPLSPGSTELSDTHTTQSLNGIPLSYILHPSHETNIPTPSDEDQEDPSIIAVGNGKSSAMLIEACAEMNLTLEMFQKLITAYFSNMTFSALFHQPSFGAKIRNVKSSTSVKALLASMFSFSARFETAAADRKGPSASESFVPGMLSHESFHKLACKYIEEALDEYADEVPSLCLLQAMVITTFYQLSKGARGKAWRFLGMCIRIAYEKNLHLIDSGALNQQPPINRKEITRWCFDEERRRCWWHIWEMDIFASTIRRCPTGIDSAQIKTFLPIHESYWFEQRYHKSCFLAIKPADRWRTLQESGNESFQAWFVVVNSLMKDAQTLSNPQAVAPNRDNFSRQEKPEAPARTEQQTSDLESLTIIDQSLRCFSLALPQPLQWHGEYLDFKSEDNPNAVYESRRRTHCVKYSIFIMTQLTRLMIHHQYAIGQTNADSSNNKNSPYGKTIENGKFESSKLPNQGLTQYLGAAENILAITNSCADTHIQCVCPFIASTIWLAAAVQLVSKKLGVESNKDLVQSKFDVLYMQCREFARFWDTPYALLQNLESLQHSLVSTTEEMGDKVNGPYGDTQVVDLALGNKSTGNIVPRYDINTLADETRLFNVVEATTASFPKCSQHEKNLMNGETYRIRQRQEAVANEVFTSRSFGYPNRNERQENPGNRSTHLELVNQEYGNSAGGIPIDAQHADLDYWWDGMEFEFEAMDPDLPGSLNGLLFNCYA